MADILSDMFQVDDDLLVEPDYRVEIDFLHTRKRSLATGMISVYEFHPGYLLPCWICPKCSRYVKSQHYEMGSFACPFCGHAAVYDPMDSLPSPEMDDSNSRPQVHQMFMRKDITWWADRVEKIFRELNQKADLYLRHFKVDSLPYTLDNSVKTMLSMRSNSNRVPLAYPIGRILKDTAAGTSLNRKIKDFLKA